MFPLHDHAPPLPAGIARRRRRHGHRATPRSPPPPKPKKILILGGTGFLGPALVAAARAHGHTLTLFNRGKTNPGRFTDLEQLHGDRDGHLEALARPQVGRGHRRLGLRAAPRATTRRRCSAPTSSHYVFVSTISVYADLVASPSTRRAPVAKLKEPTEKVTGESYGALKALCEEAADGGHARPRHRRAARAHRRPRRSDRSLHLLARAHGARRRGARARRSPNDPVAYIDVRDLANWMIVARRREAPPRHVQRARPGRHARRRRAARRLQQGRRRRSAQAHLGRRRVPREAGRARRGPTCRCGSRRRGDGKYSGLHQPRARGQGRASTFRPSPTPRATRSPGGTALPEERRAKPRAGPARRREQRGARRLARPSERPDRPRK